MCGRELDAREAKRAIVEGSLLILCPDCYRRLSKEGVVKEPPMQSRSRQVKQRPMPQPQVKQQSRKLEEYEVVEDYASRVKSARERLGWSQEVLALKIGESVNTVKRIEAGKLKPSIELARKLERVLGVKLLEPIVEEERSLQSGSDRDFMTIGDLIRDISP
jgi:putative transcription factor